MDYRSFLVKLADIFDRSLGPHEENFVIESNGSEGWDSLATLAVIALIDQAFGKTVSVKELQKCPSAKDVYLLIFPEEIGKEG